MFAGFDFKRFSLDALQDDEEEETAKATPVVPEAPKCTPGEPKRTEIHREKNEDNDWDWGEENKASRPAKRKGVSKAGRFQQREEVQPPKPTVDNSPAAPTAAVGVSVGAADSAKAELVVPQSSCQRAGGGESAQEPQLDDGADQALVLEKHADTHDFQEEGTDGLSAADHDGDNKNVSTGGVVENDGNSPATPVLLCGTFGNPIENPTGNDAGENTETVACCLGYKKAERGVVNSNGSVMDGAALSADSTDSHGEVESPRHPGDQPQYCGHDASSPAQESLEDGAGGLVSAAGICEPTKETAIVTATQAVAAMREESNVVKNAASGLESALRESRSEVEQLQEMLAMKEDTTKKQAEEISCLRDEVTATRTGFHESTEAHQRTAERCHALEEELHATRQLLDTLRAESAALKGQANEASEDRQALEGQLRHLQAGLTDGQEAARREGRQEAERLEARLKELLKDRDRKQAELDLQNARRKETREMAKDLENQLAAVERIAQEREVELHNLKDEMLALKKDTGEAKEKKNAWATKYEALERNFKQVRAQSTRAESELKEVRQNAARIEAEKTVLEERLEVEAGERVKVVASVTRERDFLLRQVDRLDQDLTELRRSHDAQATASAAQAQTSGALEEYRTRAQQALKRANEITSQTAIENKRLEADSVKLSVELARQRSLWEEAKRLDEVRQAEIAELKELFASKATQLNSVTEAMTAMKERLAQEEEDRRSAHTSVMRLEAQTKILKQELQQQQNALAAAHNKSASLQARMLEQEAALQAAESCPGGKSEGVAEMKAEVGKHPSCPYPLPRPLPTGCEGQMDGTPQSATEATGGGWNDRRRSLVESVSSVQSEGDSADASQGSIGEQLFYVHQLRQRMSKEQIEMRSLISELDASRAAAEAQAAKQAQVEKQLEAALLDKKRLQDLDSGRNAAINLTYLKNCVVGCLRTSEPSEHARLLPVITTILKLSQEEATMIAKNISARAQQGGSFGGSLPQARARDGGGSAGSTSQGWWKK